MQSKLISKITRGRKNTVTIRLSDYEMNVLKNQANEFTAGNITDYLRNAILRWKVKLTNEEIERLQITKEN